MPLRRSKPARLFLRPAYTTVLMAIALTGATLMLWLDHERLATAREELREAREMLTLALMQQPVASERIRGVTAAARLGDLRAEVAAALVDALLHDPNVNVRLACVRTLAPFNHRPERRAGIAEALLRERSPLAPRTTADSVR